MFVSAEQQSVSVGESVSVSCNVSGHPQPELHWLNKHNGHTVVRVYRHIHTHFWSSPEQYGLFDLTDSPLAPCYRLTFITVVLFQLHEVWAITGLYIYDWIFPLCLPLSGLLWSCPCCWWCVGDWGGVALWWWTVFLHGYQHLWKCIKRCCNTQ